MSTKARLYNYVDGVKSSGDKLTKEFANLYASVNEANTTSESAVTTATGAVTTANAANTAAGNAVTTANEAVTTANAANTAAGNAVTAATSAVTTANAANTTAGNAVTTANSAVSTANQAVTDAQSAETVAEQAAADAQAAAAAVASKASVAYVDQIAADFVLGALPDASVTKAKLALAVQTILDGIGDIANISTTAKEIVGGINEINSNKVTKPTTAINNNMAVFDTNQNAIKDSGYKASDFATFKKSSSTFTDRDTSQTFTDTFCTANSLVTIVITSAIPPQGVWAVNLADGSFTITSTVAESADITFDYYIQKAVV